MKHILLKERSVGRGKFNPFNRRQLKYGPWRTVKKFGIFDTERALQELRMMITGFKDRALFIDGVRRTNEDKVFTDPAQRFLGIDAWGKTKGES